MKVAVINFSGNVGKSTASRHLLSPRMNDCKIIPVETINSDENDSGHVKGKEFGNVIEAMALLDDVVVDIGASNIEALILQMKQYRGSHEDFDMFVVPTTPVKKQQRDTISTIEALREIGVPAKKIRLLFNMVEVDDTPEQVFSGLFEFHDVEKSFVLNPKAMLHVNDIYGKLVGAEQTIESVLNDPTDLKELLKAQTDAGEKLRISRQIGIKRLAAGVKEELDVAFKALTK
jgi:hypothetical protein